MPLHEQWPPKCDPHVARLASTIANLWPNSLASGFVTGVDGLCGSSGLCDWQCEDLLLQGWPQFQKCQYLRVLGGFQALESQLAQTSSADVSCNLVQVCYRAGELLTKFSHQQHLAKQDVDWDLLMKRIQKSLDEVGPLLSATCPAGQRALHLLRGQKLPGSELSAGTGGKHLDTRLATFMKLQAVLQTLCSKDIITSSACLNFLRRANAAVASLLQQFFNKWLHDLDARTDICINSCKPKCSFWLQMLTQFLGFG